MEEPMHTTTCVEPRALGMKGNLLAILAAGFLFAACSSSGGGTATGGSGGPGGNGGSGNQRNRRNHQHDCFDRWHSDGGIGRHDDRKRRHDDR
jgi:hypothetical protein